MPGVCLSIYHILVLCACVRERGLSRKMYYMSLLVMFLGGLCLGVSGVWPLDWLPLWAVSMVGPTLPPCGFPSPMASLPSWPFHLMAKTPTKII